MAKEYNNLRVFPRSIGLSHRKSSELFIFLNEMRDKVTLRLNFSRILLDKGFWQLTAAFDVIEMKDF